MQIIGINAATAEDGNVFLEVDIKGAPPVTLVAEYTVGSKLLAVLKMLPELGDKDSPSGTC